MRCSGQITAEPEITLTTRAQFRDVEEYLATKIGGLTLCSARPVLRSRVRLSRVNKPAVTKPVIAQAHSATVDLLEARMRRQLESARSSIA